jgi:PKD repeat protein
MTPPTAEGGALRAQDPWTPADPYQLGGTVIRIDPITGAGVSGNPLFSSSDANARRIVANGFRNPFRMAVRPGTNEIWTVDVGWGIWEEINRIVTPTASALVTPVVAPRWNFGWPCYEATDVNYPYANLPLNICQGLFNPANSHATQAPFYKYHHHQHVVDGDGCPPVIPGRGASITGLASYGSGSYPPDYAGALFFGDYSRECIWVMKTTNGLPDPAKLARFVGQAGSPVSLRTGPGGDLYYVEFGCGTSACGPGLGKLHRVRFTPGAPTVVANAAPTNGPAPLAVTFDATGSSDPAYPANQLTYQWDADGDGQFDDATGATATYTYTAMGNYSARLRVTNPSALSATSAPIVISVGNTPPVATIDSPSSALTWHVGQVITFSGGASDAQDGAIPPNRLTWTVLQNHCPLQCHQHVVGTFTGAGGSVTAPNHEYPTAIEIRLTATDSGGLQQSVSRSLSPKAVELTFASSPPGIGISFGGSVSTTTFSRTAIVGSSTGVVAPLTATIGSTLYSFVGWSDGGAATHSIVAGDSPATYTATYAAPGGEPTPTPTATPTPPTATPTVAAPTSTPTSTAVGPSGQNDVFIPIAERQAPPG